MSRDGVKSSLNHSAKKNSNTLPRTFVKAMGRSSLAEAGFLTLGTGTMDAVFQTDGNTPSCRLALKILVRGSASSKENSLMILTGISSGWPALEALGLLRRFWTSQTCIVGGGGAGKLEGSDSNLSGGNWQQTSEKWSLRLSACSVTETPRLGKSKSPALLLWPVMFLMFLCYLPGCIFFRPSTFLA